MKCRNGGKERYDTWEEAERALQIVRKTRKPWKSRSKIHVEVRVYPCNACRGFHLTSKPYQRSPDV